MGSTYKFADLVAANVAKAPPLTAGQVDALTVLFAPAVDRLARDRATGPFRQAVSLAA